MLIKTNPIIFRELVRALRLPRSFVNMGIILTLALIFFCFNYYVGVNSQNLNSFSGRNIFFPMAYILCLVAFPMAITSASAIVGEREDDTLELLLTTPIQAFSVIWGKFIANLITSFNYLIIILPFLSVCFVIGGLSPSDMMQCFAAILGLYIFAVSIGIMVSLFSKSTASAGRVTIWFMIVFLVGPYAIRWLWWMFLFNFYNMTSIPQSNFGIEFFINPFVSISILYASSGIPVAFNHPLLMSLSQSPGYFSLILDIILSIGILLFTAILFHLFTPFFTNQYSLLNLFPFLQRRRNKKRNGINRDEEKKRGWLTFDGFASTYKRLIYEKESLSYNRRITTNDWTIIIFCGLIAIGIASFVWFGLSGAQRGEFIHVRMMLSSVSLVIAILFSHIPSSQSIYAEHRRETWPILRTTTVPSFAIISGKMLGHFRQAALPIVAFSVIYYLVNWIFAKMTAVPIKDSEFTPILYTVVFLVICIYFYTAVGVLYSSKTRPYKKSNPGRKTFTVVLFHAFLPYIFAAISSMIFYVILPMGGAPNQWVRQMGNEWFSFFIRLSPCYIANPQDWLLRDYMIYTIHGLILLGLGYILLWSASAEIRKGKD